MQIEEVKTLQEADALAKNLYGQEAFTRDLGRKRTLRLPTGRRACRSSSLETLWCAFMAMVTLGRRRLWLRLRRRAVRCDAS